jgi:hypothetical protein
MQALLNLLILSFYSLIYLFLQFRSTLLQLFLSSLKQGLAIINLNSIYCCSVIYSICIAALDLQRVPTIVVEEAAVFYLTNTNNRFCRHLSLGFTCLSGFILFSQTKFL